MKPFRLLLVAVCVAAGASGVLPQGPVLAQAGGGVVISEFRVRGPQGGNDEFVELFNAGTSPVNIGGWLIRGSNNAGTVSTRVTIAPNTLLPGGCYFLATNTAANGYSGAVPGDQSYTVGITDDGGIGLVTAAGVLVDQVGMSAGSAFKEGTPLPSLGGTNQNRGYARTQDTNNNAADFAVLAPSAPQALTQCGAGEPTDPEATGTATPAVVEGGGTVLLTVAVTPGTNPPSTGLSVTADLSAIGGSPSQGFVDNGTAGDVTAGDRVFSHLAVVAAGTSAGVKILPVSVADAQARSGSATIGVVVAGPPLAIHTIQGTEGASPYAGQLVTTRGIVTALRSNGFFIQTPDEQADALDESSEGLFVFTSAAPVVSVGQDVTVVGGVQEFAPGGAGTPAITEISGFPGIANSRPAVRVHGSGHARPSPATILAAHTLPPNDAIAFLERFEGMRVTGNFLTVSPTAAFSQTAAQERNADPGTSRGEFFIVPLGAPRPFREPGLEPGQVLPAGAPCCVPRFDGNLERLRVDSDAQLGAARLDVPARQLLQGFTGVLDFGFSHWTLLPDPGFTSPESAAVAVPAANPGEFTVASFNMERFYDTVNDDAIPGPPDDTADVALTAAAFERRLSKASLTIRTLMNTPDIIGVVEVENLSALQAIAARVNADAVLAGGESANPEYAAFLEEGNDVGGIDVGFLVRTARVEVVSVLQIGKDAQYLAPDNTLQLLNDRPSLVLRARVRGPVGAPYPVTVIVNHLRSLNGIADESSLADGPRVRAKRRAQAEYLARYIQGLQAANPSERIVSVGDYNAFQFSDGYVDTMGTIVGSPADPETVVLASDDLVDPDLVNLVELVPAEERYSFVFNGQPQVLDHALANAPMRRRFSRLAFARGNADSPERYRAFADRPDRLSDHDPLVAYFAFPSAPIVTLNGDAQMTVEAYTGTYVEPGATAADEDGSLAVAISGTVDVTVPGEYRVRYTATNEYLTTTVERTVQVVDRTAPAISPVALSPAYIWPANHKLVDVIASYTAQDASGAATCSLSAASNEPADGRGDGDTEQDIVLVDAHRLQVRAERAGGGAGRAYTVTITCGDNAGNVSIRSATVTVAR